MTQSGKLAAGAIIMLVAFVAGIQIFPGAQAQTPPPCNLTITVLPLPLAGFDGGCYPTNPTTLDYVCAADAQVLNPIVRVSVTNCASPSVCCFLRTDLFGKALVGLGL